MALLDLFRSFRGPLVRPADAANSEGAPAYALSPEHELAQLVSTGCLAGTFYATAGEQLEQMLALAGRVAPEFVAKAAVVARARGRMKDAPALLVATLATRAPALFAAVFPRVIDDGRMLRTFVQIVRSGVTGRKSLGTLPRRLVRGWLEARSDEAVLRASVGTSPSLADVIRMVHPAPATPSRSALYAWLLDRPHDAAALPELVQRYEAWKAAPSDDVPDVPFLLLTSAPLSAAAWASIARRASWQTTRMNLATFARHGAFAADPGLAGVVAARLADRDEVLRARVFPYQLLAAYRACDATIPAEVKDALHTALEVALENVPTIDGRVHVFVDVSGSMRSPVTGARGSGSTSITCLDVAALFAAAILRKHPRAEVTPFHEKVVDVRLEPRDSVLSNAARLAALPSGGTSCSAPLERLNQRRIRGDLVVYLSDNESWVDAAAGRGTAVLEQWGAFRLRNPSARMVCVDLQPNRTTQAAEHKDVLNVGGFSDTVFDLVADFAAGRLAPEAWVAAIHAVDLPGLTAA